MSPGIEWTEIVLKKETLGILSPFPQSSQSGVYPTPQSWSNGGMFLRPHAGVCARVYQPWDGDLWKLLVVRCKHRFHHRYSYSHGHAKAETGEGHAELRPDGVLVKKRSKRIQQKWAVAPVAIYVSHCYCDLCRDHTTVPRQNDGNPNMIVWAHHIFHQDLKCRADLRAGKTCQKKLAKVSVGSMDINFCSAVLSGVLLSQLWWSCGCFRGGLWWRPLTAPPKETGLKIRVFRFPT